MTGSVLEEVNSYIPKMAQKLEVIPAFLHYALDLLPLTVYGVPSAVEGVY